MPAAVPIDMPPPAPIDNVRAALRLLAALAPGLGHLVLCPGSRSAPLAVAAALTERHGLRLHTALDERSAAFFALGLARAEGRPAAVITTSGSAVANLLPAAVEADHGTIPLLLLSADRPARLKGCGANQSVNQEQFLVHSCRWLGEGDPAGLARMPAAALEALAARALAAACGDGAGRPAGAVHLNLPFEEPLHAAAAELAQLAAEPWPPTGPLQPPPPAQPQPQPQPQPPAGQAGTAPLLDPDRAGVVVAGPWRGSPDGWSSHLEALCRWQRRSGWPVLADVLSGLRGQPDLELVAGYDLLLEDPPPALQVPQVLRLGPLPASRRLQRWLEQQAGCQELVCEGDPRPLDPLGVAQRQWCGGLASWLAAHPAAHPAASGASAARGWRQAEAAVQALLARELGGEGPWGEPWLARRLSTLLPPGLPLMLANSSPVRDWESFSDPAAPPRPVFAFRGASGIDGTLSIACGLAEALGSLVLVSGDLALLHDSNGWLWTHRLAGRLTVLLIDNDGGGIFEQLPIRTDPAAALAFERLFAMPQPVDQLALAALHGVPGREVASAAALEPALAWALQQPRALLRLVTDRRADAGARRQLRTMAARSLPPL